MIYLMLGFALLFAGGMVYWFLTALREEQKRAAGGTANRPG